MNLTGAWFAGDDKHALVFLENGEGHVSFGVETYPYFRWWIEEGKCWWQLYDDGGFTAPLSKAHSIPCVEEATPERALVFHVSPIPFGFKRFRYVDKPKNSFNPDALKRAG